MRPMSWLGTFAAGRSGDFPGMKVSLTSLGGVDIIVKRHFKSR